MRMYSSLCLHAILGLCATRNVFASLPSTSAHIYISDDLSQTSGNPTSISDSETRLILSSRLGVSRFHSLGSHVDIAKLDRVVHGQTILWGDNFDKKGQAIIAISGVENAYDLLPKSQPSFTLENSPSSSSFRELLKNLESQTEDDNNNEAKSLYTNSLGAYVDVVSPVKGQSVLSIDPNLLNSWANFGKIASESEIALFKSTDISHVALFEELLSLHTISASIVEAAMADKATLYINMMSLESIKQKHGKSSDQYKTGTQLFTNALSQLQTALDTHTYSIVLLPTSSRSAGEDLIGSPVAKKLKSKRAFTKEEPIGLQQSKTSSSSGSQPTSPTDEPPLFIKPYQACYTTEHACQNGTKSCNGRGSCITLKTQPQCWTCTCNATVVEVNLPGGKKGNKTTYWGGSACHKKDISVPFLMFAGFTIFMLVVLTSTIGMMVSMGSEDLPGTLSAGVSYKRA